MSINPYAKAIKQNGGLSAGYQERMDLTERRERMLVESGQPAIRQAPQFLKKRVESAPMTLDKIRR